MRKRKLSALGLVAVVGLVLVTAGCLGGSEDATTPGGVAALGGGASSPAPGSAVTEGSGKAVAVGASSLAGSEPRAPVLSTSSQQEGIRVTGVGRAAVVPDLAILQLGIEVQEPTVTAARDKAAAAMQAVRDALRAAGVAEADLQTRHFSIQPIYHWEEIYRPETGGRTSKRFLDGYQVTNSVVAKVRDLGRVAEAVDGAAAAGGDAVRVDSISFSAEDTEAAEEEARREAMRAALAHARQLAEVAGVSLGPAVFISESGGGQPTPPSVVAVERFAVAEAVVPTPLQAGELEVVVTVQAVFAIG